MSRALFPPDTTNWFGSFNLTCFNVPLPLCALVGLPARQGGVAAECYARNFEIFGMLYFVAGHIGLVCASFWSLLMNGFVGFQFVEDGTPLSLWLLRTLSFAAFGATYFIAAATFQGWLGGFDRENPVVLWITYYGLSGVCVLIYVVLQIILVVNTLDTRWPVCEYNYRCVSAFQRKRDVILGSTFFAIAFGCMMFAARPICARSYHYVDGLFFSSTFNFLAVLMVYKYWDSITKEDLEFSVAGAGGNWELREKLLLADGMVGVKPVPLTYYDDDQYHVQRYRLADPSH
ncbi:MAG: chitin synthase III catalytic subunit-domain-containing protein [Olpidium bornovanus]|uniref:Chitin synthase export chaperone n=1 Tax=Olpidium bornovanus TaxID=278681 RepID=A0A8H8DGH2_9FUNG|nr:MAG: chitin synthase III catalytic subunit-domain-containing protein [Olpidium bornovanus]